MIKKTTPEKKGKKIPVVADPKPIVEPLTYRLSLVDSANRAVQVDVELDGLLSGVEKVMEAYKALLKKEVEDKIAMEAHDKEVAEKLEAIHKENQEYLVDRECSTCFKKWKGGTEKCPDPECVNNKIEE